MILVTDNKDVRIQSLLLAAYSHVRVTEGLDQTWKCDLGSMLLSRKEREIPRNVKNTIQFRELAERRIITKGLNGAAAGLRAKVGVFPIDIQFEQRADIYEMILKVTYRPLPPVPEVVYERQNP